VRSIVRVLSALPSGHCAPAWAPQPSFVALSSSKAPAVYMLLPMGWIPLAEGLAVGIRGLAAAYKQLVRATVWQI
jgi:hypothetical protein